MPTASIEVHGYAIVSADDRIADMGGSTPSALMNEADWFNFQSELDRADIIVMSRIAHEHYPNLRRRRRIIVSTASQGLERRNDGWWWNPRRTPWRSVSAIVLPGGGRVAVPGGTGVYDLFLTVGYAAFHLSRARRVTLGGGRHLFSACSRGQTVEAVLAAHGLRAAEESILDSVADVRLAVWRRPAPDRAATRP
ncbi:hypothetical protein QNA08_01980 [Chelatococcus sp. SYSU_G07232]|uniref:Uncharacterized protein n=1 Tax=Chelatococcus albus TaxID=3047466 RepID=A0ABT7ACB5_9HYPH|nr:hypothetical protein [Chelatococcus sp. SYSU_G07232]MDJ1157010.1 hypothetical protein [Chelatococcus sp. SYSU_G07232]